MASLATPFAKVLGKSELSLFESLGTGNSHWLHRSVSWRLSFQKTNGIEKYFQQDQVQCLQINDTR